MERWLVVLMPVLGERLNGARLVYAHGKPDVRFVKARDESHAADVAGLGAGGRAYVAPMSDVTQVKRLDKAPIEVVDAS